MYFRITDKAQKPSSEGNRDGLTWRTADYGDKTELAVALKGFHTVLSFIQLLKDPNQQAQKNLVDACIIAGVKRFAPSEWGR